MMYLKLLHYLIEYKYDLLRDLKAGTKFLF